MKKIVFVMAVLFAAACTRHNLNYQSSHPNGPETQDNYPAPQAQNTSGGVQTNYNSANNYNNNTDGQVDYNAPSYQTFYDALSPYGSWVNYPAYGYAWVPNAGAGFTPYGSNGNWIYTSYGWTWNSGYEWGWAPFHYGRWFMDPSYGWMWVPGNQWAPAWVSWGGYNGYYGWAPVEPGAIIGSGYSPPQQYWRFVPAQNITSANVNTYYVSNNTIERNNVVLINNSSEYNQHTYFSGPQREDVEQATGSKINAVIIHESNKPAVYTMANNNLSMYRPAINAGNAKTAAPAKITPVETLKPVKTQSSPDYNYTTPKPVYRQQSNTQSPPPATHQTNNVESDNQHAVNNKPAQQGPKPAQKPAPKPKVNQPQPKPEPQKKG